jgi:hypothetical protein
MKTVKQIILDYLKKNKFDGLYNEESECGCCLDEFCLCGFIDLENCVSGYKCKVPKSKRGKYCLNGCIGKKKNNKKCWLEEEDIKWKIKTG